MRIKLRKSIREAKGFDEKGYTLLRNVSTAKSFGFQGLRGVANRGYDFLQRKQDFDSFKRTVKGESIDIGRRAAYRIGGRMTGKFMNMLVPDLPGPVGRILRIGAGQLSSKILNKVTNPLRVDLRSNFKIDANVFDNKVKNMARRGMPSFEQIQKSIQAVAINTAPDYYALEKENRKPDGSFNNNVLSAYSLTNYSPEEINRLMETADMRQIFEASEIAGADAKDIFTVIETKSGRGKHGRGTISGAVGTFESEAEAQAFIAAQKRKGKHKYHINRHQQSEPNFDDVFNQTKLYVEQTGEGALYGFGGRMPTDDELKDIIGVAYEMHEFQKSIPSAELQERVAASGGLNGTNMIIALTQGLLSSDTSVNKMKGLATTLRNIRGDVTELYGLPIKSWKNIRYAENENGDKTPMNPSHLTDEQIKDWNDFLDSSYPKMEGPPVFGPKADVSASEEKEKIRRQRAGRKKDIGTKFDKRKKQYQGNTGEKSPVFEGEYHQSTFSNNPQRHNYVASREQIKRAIHSLDPDIKDPETLITYTVAFGGKSAKSKTADAIRDAYQIEFGGPGTDKRGGLRDRTDAFVYTPSLFMFNALRSTATAFGLDRPSSNKFRLGVNATGLVTQKVNAKGFAKTPDLLDEDMAITVKGVVAEKQTRKTLSELNFRARQANLAGEALFQGGRLILDKNKILQSSVARGDLEIINEVLNDTIFGGRLLQKNFQGTSARAPFEKAIDLNLDPLSTKNIAQQLVIQDRNIRKGLATYGRQTTKDLDIFDDPIVFKSSDINQIAKYSDPDFLKFTENGVTYVLGKKFVRKITPGQVVRQGDIESGAFLPADPKLALSETAVNANITQFMLGQASTEKLIEAVASSIRATVATGITGQISEQQIRETARKLVFALGDSSGLNELDISPDMRSIIGIQVAAIINGVKDFGKFYRHHKGGAKNRTVVGDNILDLGDSTRRQITEPTFNEFVALLQDDTILTAIRASFIKTDTRRVMGKDMGGIDDAQMYQDLKKNFESSYKEVLTNIGDDGINVAYVSGPKRRPAPSGPSNKGADYGPNQTGKVTALGDQVADLNEPGVADMMEEGYRRAALKSSQSVIGLGAQLRKANNNLQSPKDRRKALNVILDRIRNGSMRRKTALNLLIAEPKLQLALKERQTGRDIGNITSAPVQEQILNPGEISQILGQILAETVSMFEFEGYELGDKGDTSAQDDFPDIFESPDF